jgi:hypothetical protein
MGSNRTTYKKTGYNVTVSKDDLINVTLERLMQYDSLSLSERQNKENPYYDPVYTKVANGKVVQVPRYVQNAAIQKWEILKERSSMFGNASAHTRLDRRERYSASKNDPYIMNRDLKNVSGARDDEDDMDEFTDYPVDRELKKLRDYERASHRDVGQYMVSSDRYGRGGSYGDLPRDFEIFSKQIKKGLGDEIYVTNKVLQNPHDVEPVGFYDYYDPRNLRRQRFFDKQARRAVSGGMRRNRCEYPEQVQAQEQEQELQELQEQEQANMELPYGVMGMEAEIGSEGLLSESESVETYAPLDANEPLEHDKIIYDYENDCRVCSKGGSGVFRKEYPLQDYRRELKYRREQRNLDRDYDYVNEPYDSDYDYDDQDGDNRSDAAVYEKADERVETLDDDDENTDYTFKYLFFILLFLVIFFFIAYKQNNENGNNNFSQV